MCELPHHFFISSFFVELVTNLLKVYKPWNENLDGDVCRRAAYDVYIPQFIRFAGVCSHVTDFNARNKYVYLTAKGLLQGYR